MSDPVVKQESAPDGATAAADARARGAYAHQFDGTGLRDSASILDAIATTLSFPDGVERSLDALRDCLTDLSWLPAGEHVLIWSAASDLADADPKAYLAIRSVLSDAQRALASAGRPGDGRRFTVVLTER
ncbi:Barstar, RNAse (barnase) inhibitor [Haloechinothrix alba]|uniref:Barstar, RNAse (Barnase) inhibitor n=1 Tax=Haloechinothrix alba TaxID=664784 RepID=A0A238XII7_9PSEU|nr:barstar family protein [Haloechinothrix alba]SNR58747.1 Barstar, RNAse (barnase) inhibitor [Haloechinothrix alba]